MAGIGFVALLACGPRDHSWEYSPSALALLNTATTETVMYEDSSKPLPGDVLTKNWDLKFDLAHFGELENFTPSIGVVFELQAQAGAYMTMWLQENGTTIAYWSGGETKLYWGTVCFQLALGNKAGTEVLQLKRTAQYTLTIAFIDSNGQFTAAKTRKITNFPPLETGRRPSKDSVVFRDLLGCP